MSARGRRALVAVLLAGFAPPGGHVYVGRPLRGFLLLLAAVASGLVWVLLAPRSLALAELSALPGLLFLLAILVDAGVLARNSPDELPPRRLHRWWVYAALVFLTQLALPEALWRLLQARAGIVLQPDAAMEPVVLEGERVVFERRGGREAGQAPERDELVVVSDEQGGLRVRRVAGLPGETVAVRRGHVRLDGMSWLEDRLRPHRRPDLSLPETRVPAGRVLVLGDRRRAGDAVQGLIEIDRVAGRATWVAWPPGFPLDLQLGSRLGEPLR